MTIQDQIKDIKAQLRLFMNGAVSHSMREKGLRYKLNLGVDLPRIKEIAAAYEPNHDLAQALWKEDVRECRILAALLQPTESFYPEIADIWVERIDNIEMAEMTSMHLFQRLAYAPAKSFAWMADEREYVQVCGFLTASRLLRTKGEMEERAAEQLLDQAFTAAHSEHYHVRQAALLVVRSYMRHNREHAFRVCRLIEGLKDSENECTRRLCAVVQEEAEAMAD